MSLREDLAPRAEGLTSLRVDGFGADRPRPPPSLLAQPTVPPAALRRAPVRRLGGELYRYLFKAMTTWGTDEDFKHFVPRLLELYASSADARLLCDKLAYARWRSWPTLERGAVEGYVLSLWRERLAEDGPPLPGVALLETMLGLDLDLAPYDLRAKLDAWRSARSRESIRSLARFVREHGDARGAGSGLLRARRRRGSAGLRPARDGRAGAVSVQRIGYPRCRCITRRPIRSVDAGGFHTACATAARAPSLVPSSHPRERQDGVS